MWSSLANGRSLSGVFALGAIIPLSKALRYFSSLPELQVSGPFHQGHFVLKPEYLIWYSSLKMLGLILAVVYPVISISSGGHPEITIWWAIVRLVVSVPTGAHVVASCRGSSEVDTEYFNPSQNIVQIV